MTVSCAGAVKGAVLSACRKPLQPALQNRRVATQPCDSHWICAKSVFENARCQKRKSRGRPTTEIGPWRRRRSEPFFCTKLSARDPKTRAGERRGLGLSIMSCSLLAWRLQPLLDPEPRKSPEPSRWDPEPNSQTHSGHQAPHG